MKKMKNMTIRTRMMLTTLLTVSIVLGIITVLIYRNTEKTIENQALYSFEENVQKILSVTTLLEQGHTPESLLEKVLEGFDVEINDRIDTQFYCNCSKERVEKALISIGRKDLNEMIQEGKEIELNCHFCNKNYKFSVEELNEILRKCK